MLGALRLKLGVDLNAGGEWRPLWVTDFPMFEAIDGQLHALHHPFTAPRNMRQKRCWQNLKARFGCLRYGAQWC